MSGKWKYVSPVIIPPDNSRNSRTATGAPVIKFAPDSLTAGIEIGSRVLLPTLRSGGVVVAIGYHDDGVPRVFVVKLAGEALPFLLPRNEVMRAPPGALFLSPGGDDVAPSRPFFHACGGVA